MEAVELYNNERMHRSLDFKKLQEVYLQYNKQENKNYKREKKVAKNKIKSIYLNYLYEMGLGTAEEQANKCQNHNRT